MGVPEETNPPVKRSASGLGLRSGWYSRKTTYPGFFEPRKTQSEWRAFINAVFPFPFR